jgi:hypothetical protein
MTSRRTVYLIGVWKPIGESWEWEQYATRTTHRHAITCAAFYAQRGVGKRTIKIVKEVSTQEEVGSIETC